MQSKERNIIFNSDGKDKPAYFTIVAPPTEIRDFAQALIDHLNKNSIYVQPPRSESEEKLSRWVLELHNEIDEMIARKLIAEFKLQFAGL